MSRDFNWYLSERLIEYFRRINIQAGKKYFAKFDNECTRDEFYSVLKEFAAENKIDETFIYDKDNSYVTYVMKIFNTKILVAKEDKSVTLDFLTKFRNSVGPGREYEDYALLLIISSDLDSIIDGTESLHREGLPFYYALIIQDIERKIEDKSNNLSEIDKAIIRVELENKRNDRYGDRTSLELYKPILEMIDSGKIEQSQYKSFGMFYDSDLKYQEGANAFEKRIKENREWHEKIYDAIRNANVEETLSADLGDSLLEKLKKLSKDSLEDDWSDNFDFKTIKKSIEEKKNRENININNINLEFISQVFCDEDSGFYRIKKYNKDVKKKKEDWIVFNEDSYEQLTINISLSEKLKKDAVKTKNGDKISFICNGTSVKGELDLSNKNGAFSKIIIEDQISHSSIEINLCVINCPKECFDMFISKITNIDVKKKAFYIVTDDNLKFNINKESGPSVEISNKMIYTIEKDKSLELQLTNTAKEVDDLEFILRVNNFDIRIFVEQSQGKSQIIDGVTLFKHKLEKIWYAYDNYNKVIFNQSEYKLDEKLKAVLDYEKYIINNDAVLCSIKNNKIEKIDSEIPSDVLLSYNAIINYYKTNNTLPSLCPINKEIYSLFVNYIETINNCVDYLEDNKPITNNNAKNIYLIGACINKLEDVILLSPLHPINIAHQIALYKEKIDKGLKKENVRKLNSRYAFPYFYYNSETLYKVLDNNDTLIEWKKYVRDQDLSKNGDYYFVNGLIINKIDLFTKHFSCIFNDINNKILKINLVNMGDCSEAFNGIIRYFFKNYDDDSAKDIIVTIYNDGYCKNDFEILSNESQFRAYLKSVKEKSKVNLNEIMAYIKSKLSFYVKSINDSIFEYAHLTFYEMSSGVTPGNNNMNDIESGVSLNSVLTGITSAFIGNSYRTSFGAKDLKSDLSSTLYKNLNSLALFSRRSDPFNRNQCISTEVKNEKADLLKKVYKSSHWVTFIDPKVDLSYFVDNQNDENLTIIHYSDQYTTSTGYDAITVTNKTKQYIELIREHMQQHKLYLSDEDANKVINTFNAVNGNWLLKLMSSNVKYEKEKISLISAVKLAMAKFEYENVIWVPLAMEEILRVTGANKLSTKQGLLATKNLESTNGCKSDDLLMIGVDYSNIDKLKVYLHPIEVKIGEQSYIYSSKEKAKKQIESVKKNIYDKSLKDEDDPMTLKRMRRNYLMQLLIIAAQKFKLYNIWNGQDWNKLTTGPIREKLLNEDYELNFDLDKKFGIGSVFQFANIDGDNNIKQCKDSECSIIQSTVKYALQLLNKDIDEIKDENNFEKLLSIDEMIDASEEVNEVVENSNDCVEKVEDDVYNNKSLIAVEDNKLTVEETPLIATNDAIGIKIEFGERLNGTKYFWYPNDTNRIMHPNTGIIGTMGTGKTQFTKSLITQFYRESVNNVDGKDIGILIFDYKGDYNTQKKDFINATNAKVYQLYKLPFNPLAISKNIYKPMLPLHVANTFKETLSQACNLGIKQETLLRDVIMQAYTEKGIDKANRDTWQNEAPTFKDVYEVYKNKPGIKEDSLYSILSTIDEFEIFEPNSKNTKSLYDLINGVTVIDLSGYDTQIQNIVVAITLDLFYSQMQSNGHSKIAGNLRQLSKLILVDEADNFLSQGFKSIKKIMKEGREYGVGTILSTQLLSHFSNDSDDFADYIFTWVVHNVSDLSVKDIRKIFNAQSKVEEEKLYRDIKNLQKHNSIVKISSAAMAEHIKDLPFYKLI